MKRALAAMLSAAVLSGVMAVPATAGSVVCDQKAMRTILNLGYGVFGTPYERCTFRLFLAGGAFGQEPVWTESEYFHGGNFFEVVPAEVVARGWTRSNVNSYYAQIEQHLYWGENSMPDAQLVELPLQRGRIYRLAEAVPQLGWPAGTYVQETYFDFPPQAPGFYKWRYTFDDSILFGSLSRVGHVLITPA